jgi:hypothetical protein
MANKSELQLNADKYIRFLKKQSLLTDEHALTVSLVKSLAEEWSLCTSSTQRAAIAKELRACIDMLPHTETPIQDVTQTFLEQLEKV